MHIFNIKICIIFQNFPENAINDIYKLCYQNYCTSLKTLYILFFISNYEKEQLNCINHFLG